MPAECRSRRGRRQGARAACACGHRRHGRRGAGGVLLRPGEVLARVWEVGGRSKRVTAGEGQEDRRGARRKGKAKGKARTRRNKGKEKTHRQRHDALVAGVVFPKVRGSRYSQMHSSSQERCCPVVLPNVLVVAGATLSNAFASARPWRVHMRRAARQAGQRCQ